MLRPSKHSNADLTVVAIAAFILARLKKKRLIAYQVLFDELVARRPLASELFTPAISLLFLFGVVEYRPKGDSFEYTGLGS
jgi:hypothetical protein